MFELPQGRQKRKRMSTVSGTISQIIGPVVDVHFQRIEEQDLPAIHEALEVTRSNGRKLVIEVQQHIGEDTVRCVAMDSTDGLRRGMEARCTGAPISMPVGAQIRGRVMNVVGETIDGLPELTRENSLPIHREAPKFEDLTTSQENLYTGKDINRFTKRVKKLYEDREELDRDREFFYNRYRNLYTTENHVMRHVRLYMDIKGTSNRPDKG